MLGPERQRQTGVARALGKLLWNPLGEPQPAHSPVTQAQHGQDFWSHSRKEGREGGGEISQAGISGAGSKAGILQSKGVPFLEHLLHATHLT